MRQFSETTPYGLFRYLYNHYEVRYPDYSRVLNRALTDEQWEVVESVCVENIPEHLRQDSWLIGIARPDLAPEVRKLWASMSPMGRGNYNAGLTESVYLKRSQDPALLSFVRNQLNDSGSIELTAETACQIGCCLLGMGMAGEFADLLNLKIDWCQEINRASGSDAKRWKTLNHLSNRVIDIFLEASLILNQPEAVELLVQHGADPNILIWKLERSSNALYPALSYAIKNNLESAVDTLFENGADPCGSQLAASRSPLALAFYQKNLAMIERLLTAGVSLDDGPRHEEPPLTYGWGIPVEWVTEQLSDLLELMPLEAKPLFHSPGAQGGFFYTLLECLWSSSEGRQFAETIGLDLRLTTYETAQLIQRKNFTTFRALTDRLGKTTQAQAIARVQQKWSDFCDNEK